jgi:hypothetical protein
VWRTAFPPLSGRVFRTSATVASLVHSKITGSRLQTHLLWQACLFKIHAGACPSPFLQSAQGTPLYLLCVLFSSLFFIQLFFFPGQGLECPGGYAGLSRGGCGDTTCRLFAHLLVCMSSGTGALLVSPYIVAWGRYVWAGGLGVSEFCFFLVVFPPRCVSSISARFLLYGAHTICFLPLVTILEPPSWNFNVS